MVVRLWWALSIVALSITDVSVSVANNFIHTPTAAYQGYHAFGELARFIYCLLQKIKTASSLPLVEHWEEYVAANHSRFAPIDDKNFLEGTHVMAALGKVSSQYLQKEFRRDAHRFLEDFVSCVHRCRTLNHRAGFKLFLPCNRGWWGRCCSITASQ